MWFSVCLCEYMFMYVCVCVFVPAVDVGYHSQPFLFLFLKTGSLTGDCQFNQTGWSVSPRVAVSTPQHWNYKCVPWCLAFFVKLGSWVGHVELQSSCLHVKHFTYLSPHLFFFFFLISSARCKFQFRRLSSEKQFSLSFILCSSSFLFQMFQNCYQLLQILPHTQVWGCSRIAPDFVAFLRDLMSPIERLPWKGCLVAIGKDPEGTLMGYGCQEAQCECYSGQKQFCFS